MQAIGFNLTKISASRQKELKNIEISNNMDFVSIDKEKVELIKEKETYKVEFKSFVDYHDREVKEKAKDKDKVPKQAEIAFEGNVILMVSTEEAKEILKSWKKKDLPTELRVFLFNFIMRKCSPHALSLQEELKLPTHIQIPQLILKNTQNQ